MVCKSDNLEFEFSLFKNPTSRFSPVMSWILNSNLTKKIVKEQIDEMQSIGVGACYILPEPQEFRPDTMATEMNPPYLSEEFFKIIRYAIEYAKEKGMVMWLYDEGGWPSGSACGQITKAMPEKRIKKIVKNQINLKKGEIYTPNSLTISVFDTSYNMLDCPFCAQNDRTIYEYAVKELNVMPANTLDCEAVDKFIELTHEGYKKHMGNLFGDGAFAMFTDEPAYSYPCYIKDTKEFEKTYNYNFKQMVPALIGDNVLGEKGKQFKIDYIEYCAKIFTKNYFEKIHKWCQQNNLLFCGHLDGDHQVAETHENGGALLEDLRQMDIPGIDVIWRQIYPGNKDMNFFPRFASSAARQVGARYALSESFGVYSCGLTFDLMRYVGNYQFVRGINIINIMSFPTGRERFLSAGSNRFTKEIVGQEYTPVFMKYYSRMQYLASVGKVNCDIALYMPDRDAWVENFDAEKSFYAIGKELEENHIYFDVVDDIYICRENICGGALGTAGYKVIILPETRYIKKQSLNKLCEFVKNGGVVLSADSSIVCGARRFNIAELTSYRDIECANKNIRVIKRTGKNDNVYIFYNESTSPQTFCCRFSDNFDYCYRLNPLNGQVYKFLPQKEITLLSGEECAILFTNNKIDTVPEYQKGSFFTEVTIDDCQKLERVKLNDGKFVKTNQSGSMPQWEKDYSGTACYHGSFKAKKGEAVILDLGTVNYHCTVFVNGTQVGMCIMPPYELCIDGSVIKDHNTIEITVSNTCANELYHLKEGTLPDKMFSVYRSRTRVFEKDSLPSGLMSKVKVYRAEQ